MATEIIPNLSLCAPAGISQNLPSSKGFLGLPAEIRLEIYRYCFPPKRVFDVDTQYRGGIREHISFHQFVLREKNKNMSNVLLLSKMISEEALNVLYGENTFRVTLNNSTQASLGRLFSVANRKRIRHLEIDPSFSSLDSAPDQGLWASILPTLTTLAIYAERPWRGTDEYIRCESLHVNYEHVIESYWQCFGQHISMSETSVEVLFEYDWVAAERLATIFQPNKVKLVDNNFRRYFDELHELFGGIGTQKSPGGRKLRNQLLR